MLETKHPIIKYILIVTLMVSSLFAQIEMRVSTENGSDHIQTEIVSGFVETVNEKLGDKIHAVHYDSGQLFRDKDVINALARGQVDMAVPGNWHLDKFDRKAGIFLLPSFYGMDYATLNTLRDGTYGKTIDGALESRTGTLVLGRWIDLGYAHIYTFDKPIKSYEDLKDMRIRVAGGSANIARIRALGGNAVSIPWGDLPSAIKEGKIDGVLTTHETIASAKLWEKGIRYCFEDENYFPMYIPLVSKKFYNRLDPATQAELRALWEAQVELARQQAIQAQKDARDTLVDNGVQIVTPTKEEKEKARANLMQAEPELLKQLDIDPVFIEKAFKPKP